MLFGQMDLIYCIALLGLPFVVWSLFAKRKRNQYDFYEERDWLYAIKYILAFRLLKASQKSSKNGVLARRKDSPLFEDRHIPNSAQEHEGQNITAIDINGNSISMKMTRFSKNYAQLTLCLKLENGSVYTLPDHDEISLQSVHPDGWYMRGLRIQVLEPYKRMRIVFNGMLKNLIKPGANNLEFVKFNFIFNSIGSKMYYPEDADTKLLSEAIAKETWRDNSWIDKLGGGKHFQQFGMLQGIVVCNENESFTLRLPTLRRYTWGTSIEYNCHEQVSIFIAAEDGLLFDLTIQKLKDGCRKLVYGFALTQAGEVLPIKDVDVRSKLLHSSIPDVLMVYMKEHKRSFDLDNSVSHYATHLRDFKIKILHTGQRGWELDLSETVAINKHKRTGSLLNSQLDYNGSPLLVFLVSNHTHKCIINFEKHSSTKMSSNVKNGYAINDLNAQCSVDDAQGRGSIQFWHSTRGNCLKFPLPLLLPEESTNSKRRLVIRLTDEGASSVRLSGGKGSSLALLSTIESDKFTVPEGYIITTRAFRKQMECHRSIKEAIFALGKSIRSNHKQPYKEMCQQTVNIIENQEICAEVITCIRDALRDEFSKEKNYHGYAVRSSSVHEDCEGLSAAGQNKSFLSCKTEDDILKAVCACWASQFSYESVSYRRQRGLPVISDIAVVIQRMVPADSAGVLFSCHPTTGNPSQIVITSNFGLGESVVSGQADPDLLILKTESNRKISILSKKLGMKNCKIEIGDEYVKNVAGENSDVFSISDDQVTHVGSVGILLEDMFGSPRDVEWAFYKNQLYLLQCRPITTLNGWSDFELFHEFDVPILSEDVIHTMANAGEICPGALNVLSQTTTRYTASLALSLHSGGVHKESMPTIQHHSMIDVINSIHRNPKSLIDINARIIDLAVFGHPVIDERIHSIALRQHGVLTTWKQIAETLRMYRFARKNEKILNAIFKLSNSMRIDITDTEDLKIIFTRINDFIKDMTMLSKLHCIVSGTPVFYQIVAMNVLAEDKTELCQEHYNDISLLLSSCNDISSAEIPKTLEEIVQLLQEYGLSDRFASIDPLNGLEFLKASCPTVFQIIQKFLDKHGHRLLREFDLQKNTWKRDPSQLIRMLQVNCKSNTKSHRSYEDVSTIISKIRSPKRKITRYILRLVMSRARTAIGIREKSKSELVRSFDKLRSAYRTLAQLMCQKGILPRKSLIYHLSHHEVGQMIYNHNIPELISKAMRRQKLYPEWDKQRYPEIMFGIPKPLESSSESETRKNRSDVVCKGTPVYLGKVQARACVITRVEDADQLKAGDILVTYSTDIGWSPYFPSLVGLVTELGGLISHGAVIAREYGLPCIVGAQNCTSLFQTGDIVLLSANTGVLELLEKSRSE